MHTIPLVFDLKSIAILFEIVINRKSSTTRGKIEYQNRFQYCCFVSSTVPHDYFKCTPNTHIVYIWLHGVVIVVTLRLLCPAQGALSDDAVWRLSRCRPAAHACGRRVRPAGWMAHIGWSGPARLDRPGPRLPLRASVSGMGGGISWRPPAYSLLTVFNRASARYACRARYCYSKSVRLSVTLRYCIETNAHIVKLFPTSGKDMTLFFQLYRRYKIPRGTPSVGTLNTRG